MSKREKILITTEIHPDGLRHLKDAGYECVVVPESDPAQTHAAAPEVVGIVANASFKFDEAFFSRAAQLRVLGRKGVGYDNVDIEAARRRRIRVVNTPLSVIEPVAEQAILFFLALARRLIPGDGAVRAGRWREPGNLPGAELKGKVLALIGLGNTARRVAEIAVRGFTMSCVYFDKVARPEAEAALGLQRLGFDEALAAGDFVSVHVNLSSETRGFIGAQQFACMKKGAFFVNLARGPVVDERALLEALRSGHLGGAGLDVFEVEPPGASNPLLRLPNVVLSPHIGGASTESLRGGSMVTLDIVRILRGEEPVHGVA